MILNNFLLGSSTIEGDVPDRVYQHSFSVTNQEVGIHRENWQCELDYFEALGRGTRSLFLWVDESDPMRPWIGIFLSLRPTQSA